MTHPISDAELTKFGVGFADEWPHAFDPAVEWWNESWFWDWFDADGRVAGHCRFGLHPNQQRAWIWYFHWDAARGEWIAVEEPRLPIGDVCRAASGGPSGANGACFAYDRFGLSFAWEPASPLRAGRFRFAGFGRVVTGPRAGMVLPVAADLRVDALGAAHSTGRSNAPGHASQQYPASRFEQPIAVAGRLCAGDAELDFRGRGERDHSWGPRHWNLEWTFTVLNGDDLRLQCAEARIPNVPPIHGGYVARAESQSITAARFDYRYADDDLARAVEGRLEVTTEDGARLAFDVEPISAVEIDITHTFVPPQRSVYRRALVRAARANGPPLLGWTEFNRFVKR
ncbi:MAG: hypothetical protein DCC71_14585 [Proteobacteria bacterium]|nr:MAG: hypothetical protein DCC71_14585 [Pseudomonadota bacterium]